MVCERGLACTDRDVDPVAQPQVAQALDLSLGCCNRCVRSVYVGIVTRPASGYPAYRSGLWAKAAAQLSEQK